MTEAVDGWTIRPDHTSAFVRVFVAVPDEPLKTDYATNERRNGRLIAATYPAHVDSLRIRWQWDEERKRWWWQANLTLWIINHRTGEPYLSGWRAEPIYRHFSALRGAHADYVDALILATNPRSIVTVTEVPA